MERAFSRGILRGRAGQIGKASLRFSARNVQGRNLEAAAYLLFPFLPGFTGFYRVLPGFTEFLPSFYRLGTLRCWSMMNTTRFNKRIDCLLNLPRVTEFYRVFTGFLLGFYWVFQIGYFALIASDESNSI